MNEPLKNKIMNITGQVNKCAKENIEYDCELININMIIADSVKSALEWYKEHFSNPSKLAENTDLIKYIKRDNNYKGDGEWHDTKTNKVIFYQDYEGTLDYDLYNSWLLDKAFEDVTNKPNRDKEKEEAKEYFDAIEKTAKGEDKKC